MPRAFAISCWRCGRAPTASPTRRASRPSSRRIPESARAISLIKGVPFSSGFANATYNSLVTFRAIDAAGKSTPLRWSMRRKRCLRARAGRDAQGQELSVRCTGCAHCQGARAMDADAGARPAQRSDQRRHAALAGRSPTIDAGTLSITALQTEAAGNCRDVNFDPLVLPAGIEPSDDPLLSARSAAYSVSFTRRANEAKTPSAVHVGEGR